MKPTKLHPDYVTMAKFISQVYLPKKNAPVTAKQMSKEFNDRLSDFNARFKTGINKVAETHIRDMINYSRSNQLVKNGEILACPAGYYISDDLEDILRQIESLEGRISAINNAIHGMRKRSSLYTRKTQTLKHIKTLYTNKKIEGDLFDSL